MEPKRQQLLVLRSEEGDVLAQVQKPSIDDSHSSAHPSKSKMWETKSNEPSEITLPSTGSGEKRSNVDSGLQCWLQVLGAFIIWTNTWGLSNAYGVFQTYYESDLGFPSQSPSNLSWIGSVQPFLLLFVGVLSGPLYDAGYFKALLVVGNSTVVFGLMMTSICKEYWQAVLAQGMTCGIGYGLLFTPGVSVIPQYFVKRRLLASGLAAAGSGVGGLIYPIVFHRLQPRIGFGWTVRVIGFITLFLGIISVLVMRTKTTSGKIRKLFDYHTLGEPPFALNTIGLFFALAGLYVPYYYIGTYTLTKNIAGQNLAFYLVPIMNAGSIAGRVIPQVLADRTGPFNMLIPCTLIAGVLSLCWIAINNSAGLIVFAVLYGFFSGSFLSLPPTTVAALTQDMTKLGTRTGTAFALSSFGVLIGTPICGAILRDTRSFLGLQVFGGVCVLAAAAFVAASRVAKAGWGWTKI